MAPLESSPAPWISTPPGAKSPADWIASRSLESRQAFLRSLSPNALAALPWLFDFWARAGHQLPPTQPDWSIWVLLGGRGSGKTRAGAEWIRTEVEGATPLAQGRSRRVALVAETLDQARDIMVLGDSGLLAVTPPDRRPDFQISRRRLVWRNGAEAFLFSAKDPESLRGPQFDAAWCDELAKWRRARAAWDMLQFGVRLGSAPRQVISTTPRPTPLLMELIEQPNVVVSRAATADNAANLAPAFLRQVVARYGGTALGRQELDGEILIDAPGALWTREMLEAARIDAPPRLDRVVVAVDPPTTAHAGSDACGIVVAGVRMDGPVADWRGVVLEDRSVQGASPQGWAARAVAAYRERRADRLVAEVNQGGDMVEAVVRQIDPSVAFRAVRARRGKVVRAEPVAALYEQGRIAHLGRLDALEDQMCALSRWGARPLNGARSPDRVDALVWALTDLMLDAPAPPQVRAV